MTNAAAHAPARDTYFGFSARPDEYLREALAVHFDPTTGSNYWLKRAAKLGLDVFKDIQGYDDLHHFGLSNGDDLRTWRLEDLVPRSIAKGRFFVAESSGTTGPVKKIPWYDEPARHICDWYEYNLNLFGIPSDINWLSIGPYGLYEDNIHDIVRRRNGLLFFVGIEPMGLKSAVENASMLRPHRLWYLLRYMRPMFDKIDKIFETQDIGMITGAPQICDELHKRAEKHGRVDDIAGILLSGLSTTPEAIEHAQGLFPKAAIIPMYANIFWGPTFDHYKNEGFVPEYYGPSPLVTFKIVNPESKKVVKYGERGRIMFHRVDKGFFWPNALERDMGERIRPKDPYPWDGIRLIEPYKGASF